MYMKTGYIRDFDQDIVDDSLDITVTCAGHYKLITKKQFKTTRVNGRNDYQLLYIANGKAHFLINGNKIEAEKGSVILYSPKDSQEYIYYLDENPDIYWIHFSGSDPQKIIDDSNIIFKRKINILKRHDYIIIMDKIIQEIQKKEIDYLNMCNLYIKQLFLLIKRSTDENTYINNNINKEIQNILDSFEENYNKPLFIAEYAKNHNISICWLIKLFKQQVGITPKDYLINIRLNKAKELLITSEYTINEIAEIVGYEDALYFSRLFKKRIGMSPTQYKNSR